MSVNEQNKGCAYIHSGIDVARTVQRIETDNIRSIQMVGGQNKLFLLLAIDSSNLNTASFDFMSQPATFGDAYTSPQFLRKWMRVVLDSRSSFLTISPDVLAAPLAEPVSPCTGATATAWDIILQEVARAPMRLEKPAGCLNMDQRSCGSTAESRCVHATETQANLCKPHRTAPSQEQTGLASTGEKAAIQEQQQQTLQDSHSNRSMLSKIS